MKLRLCLLFVLLFTSLSVHAQQGGGFKLLAEPKVGYVSGDLESSSSRVRAGSTIYFLIEGVVGVRWSMFTGGVGLNTHIGKIEYDEKDDSNQIDKFLHFGFIPLPFLRVSFDYIFKSDYAITPIEGGTEQDLDGSGIRLSVSAGIAPSTLFTISYTSVSYDTLLENDVESQIDGVSSKSLGFIFSWPFMF